MTIMIKMLVSIVTFISLVILAMALVAGVWFSPLNSFYSFIKIVSRNQLNILYFLLQNFKSFSFFFKYGTKELVLIS